MVERLISVSLFGLLPSLNRICTDAPTDHGRKSEFKSTSDYKEVMDLFNN